MEKNLNLRSFIVSFIMMICLCEGYSQDLPVIAVIDNRSIDVSHIAKSLDARLNTALKSAGIHSQGEEGLYLVGELIPISEETVETGMRKMVIKKFELSLRIEQPLLNLQFGQTIIQLKGSGFDSKKAAMDAIQHLKPSGIEIQNFISSALHKAHEYYTTHIDAIIDKANILSKMGQYDEAITLLWACPNSSSIHTKVFSALDDIYMGKQNHECSMIMKQAESAYALKNYDEMKRLLDSIDSNSQCAASASALAKKAGVEIRHDEKIAIEREERDRERAYLAAENDKQREYNLEQQRISSISDIAKEYLRNHRSTYHYYVY
ncbi:MAG: hypothetical protein K2K88_09785 [Muribaculaceae bacterium]|nr:hypothetical protein [Muribaculaceae bacterium]MDE6643837.1 hypothetical protein [Muribaculaceae bacterium]